MKKIPTLFERDWNGDRSRVVDQIHAGCEWVIAGEGIATQKLDGTSCMIRDGQIYKRRELRKGNAVPNGFEIVDHDEETGKTVGWVLCSTGPEDRWHLQAFLDAATHPLKDGTYELLGPKVQGNPEKAHAHILEPHGQRVYDDGEVPRTFDGLKDWLATQNIEGIVFHHEDGRMAKIKLRDFGLKRTSK
jgi:hypothetical protein